MRGKRALKAKLLMKARKQRDEQIQLQIAVQRFIRGLPGMIAAIKDGAKRLGLNMGRSLENYMERANNG